MAKNSKMQIYATSICISLQTMADSKDVSEKELSSLAQELRVVRLTSNLTMEQFSTILGINRNYVSDYEKGKKEIPLGVWTNLQNFKNEKELEKTGTYRNTESTHEQLLRMTSKLLSRFTYPELRKIADLLHSKIEDIINKDATELKRYKRLGPLQEQNPKYL